MSKKEWKKWIGAVGSLLLAFVFVFSQTAWAGQDPQTKDKADSLQKGGASQTGEKQSSAASTAKARSKQVQGEESESSMAQEKSSRDGSHEGIKVHGHWTIEVRNLDGSVATHREFENSLASGSGAQALVALLSHTATVGFLQVLLYGPNCAIGGYPYCSIIENIPGSFTANGVSNNLTLSVKSPPIAGSGASTLTLNGNVTPVNSTQITQVQTGFLACTPDTSPQACFPAANAPGASYGVPPLLWIYGLTSANISALSVQSGQTVAVTVVLSFS
jgi:hypothetical protein